MNNKYKLNKINYKLYGQAILEMALALPIFMLFLIAIFDFARVFHAWASLNNQVVTAVRLATRRQHSLIRGIYGPNTHTPREKVLEAFHKQKSPWIPSNWISKPLLLGVGDNSREVTISATCTVELITPGAGLFFYGNKYVLNATAREAKE